MSFQFNCPKCKNLLEAEDSWDGLETTCPMCNQKITIVKDDKPVQLHCDLNKSAPEQKQEQNINVVINKPDISFPQKNRVVYVLLGIFFGGLGIHNFYAGRSTIGIVQLLLTLFCFGWLFVPIWVLVELFVITNDGNGQTMKSYIPSIIVLIAYFAFWILAGLVILFTIFASGASAINIARSKARTISCTSNMKQLGTEMVLYALDHNDRLPPTLDSLSDSIVSTKLNLKCSENNTRYLYLGAGLKQGDLKDPGEFPIVIEYPGHNGKFNVLFLDGHVEVKRYSGIHSPSDLIKKLSQGLSAQDMNRLASAYSRL